MNSHICPLCGTRHWDHWKICIVCRWFYGVGIVLALLAALSVIGYYQLQ